MSVYDRLHHLILSLSLFPVRSIQMADRGVVSRFRGREMHCDECIRVTIGTPEENRQFLDMLKRVYAEIAE